MKKILCLFFTFFACISHVYSANLNWSQTLTVLSGGSDNASDPQIAIDPNGNSVAVWIENNVVVSSAKFYNSNWHAAATISSIGASSPRLVIDSNGNTTAIWLQNGVITSATKNFNSNWSSTTALSSSGASNPALCVDSEGDVIAAWVRNGNVESKTKLFGGAWQTNSAIKGTSATTLHIAIGGTGTGASAFLVWEGTSNGTNVIYSSTKTISGSWSAAQVISQIAHNAAQPYTAVDPNGNALAIWYSYDNIGTNFTNVVVKSAAYSSTSSSWGEVTHLSHPGIRDPGTLKARVAFDSVGNGIALWNTSYDDETFMLESAVKPLYGSWSLPVSLVDSNLYAYSADLSATSFGDVLGLYMFYNGAALLIQSIESDFNGFLNNFWSVPITISQGTNNANPKIAATLKGNSIQAAAVWVLFDGTHKLVVASTGSKTLVRPPSHLKVIQSESSFGVFDEYYNTLTWHASPDPLAVGYLVFRNGIFLEQLGANVLQYIDYNRVANEPITYSVTAIDSQQSQSQTVSVSFP